MGSEPPALKAGAPIFSRRHKVFRSKGLGASRPMRWRALLPSPVAPSQKNSLSDGRDFFFVSKHAADIFVPTIKFFSSHRLRHVRVIEIINATDQRSTLVDRAEVGRLVEISARTIEQCHVFTQRRPPHPSATPSATFAIKHRLTSRTTA